MVDSKRDVHLLVIVHGLWGSTAHVQSIVNTITEVYETQADPSYSPELKVLCPKTNESDMTYDGIDLCGHRVVQEIDALIDSIATKVVKFSIVGYSLGGLIARYAIGVLESRSPSFFDEVEACNFTTFASPAIGIPRFPTFISRAFNYLGARLLSNTGEQIHAADDYLNGKPLLEILAQPGTNFHNALLRFKKKQIYANSVNDRTVPFATGAFPKDYRDEFARADRLARPHSSDPGGLSVNLEDGGLHIILYDDCPYIIRSIERNNVVAKIIPQSRIPRLPSMPFFLRPSTFKGIPYGLGYVLPFLMPVLLPSMVVYVGGRFVLQSRSSRQRIRAMYSGDLSTPQDRLKRVGLALEDTFEEIAEDTFPLTGSSSESENVENTDALLTPAQKRMSDNLNAIPGLEKYFVYLPEERNSHGAIVARDVRWEGHKKGLDILRWWADRFLI